METRRVLLAMALSFAVLLVWQMAFPPAKRPLAEPATTVGGGAAAEPPSAPAPPPQPESAAGALAAGAVPGSAADAAAAAPPAAVEPPIEALSEQVVELTSGATRVRVSNRGGVLLSFEVAPSRAGRQELLRPRGGAPAALSLVDPAGEPLPLDGALFAVEQSDETSVALRYRGALGAAEKRIVLTGAETFELHAAASVPGFGLWLGPGLRSEADQKGLEKSQRNRGVVVGRGRKVETLGVKGVTEPTTVSAHGLSFVGLEDLYFVAAVIPHTPLQEVRLVPWLVSAPAAAGSDDGASAERPLLANASKEERKALRDLGVVLVAGERGIGARGFFGAKQYERLRAEGVGLERTIRWGFFRFLAVPLYHGLQFLHDHVVANYGWCIVLMTMAIRVLLLPLTHTSYVSMQKMQGLNPKMEAIRARYRPRMRDSKGKPNLEVHRKMNEEIQALFRQEGVNPAGGCLPLLAQIPVFFSFFYLLQGAVELWRAPWIWWIKDLSAPDPTTVVLPVIMGVTQFLSQRLMPPPPNQAQRILINTMPIWFTFFSLGFPSGLVLYWMTNNVLTMVQQWTYNKLKRRGGEVPARAK